MRISTILLKNFKSYKSQRIEFKNLIALTGENNAGKSNILKALDLFFADTKKLDQEFFNDPKDKIVIQVSFNDLNEEAKKNFKKYLLDDNETVIIRKEYSLEAEEPQRVLAVILGEKFEGEKDKKDAVEILTKEEIFPFDSTAGKNYYWKPKPFGWASVAVGYLPDFLYVPAVKDIKEESKITATSRFGKIVNAMLNSVLENEELKKVNEQFAKLLQGENESQDGRIAQLKEFESMLSEKLAECMKGTTIKLDVAAPNIKEVFQSGTKILVNDGVLTSIETKGHGMQRSVIFVIFRAYAELLKKEQGEKTKSRSLIFGVEEPELYLHPQMQRTMYALLKEISETDQVIFTTHSSFFVDMTNYQSICIVLKRDLTEGTKVIQCQKEIFSIAEEKKQFQLLTEFDPERNELFFAKKVVLVEGDTEKAVLPLIAKKVDSSYIFYEHGITIVECGSKNTLPLFMKVLNSFRIKYITIYDKDTSQEDINLKIENEITASGGIGVTEILDPDFETICANEGVVIPAGKNKPFKAFQIFKDIDSAKIPNRLKEVIQKIFS